ncbi:MAG TPA: hypothetical protein VN366_12770 [Feifaniaceae bacterium]|nr:hypothetical protein [Feifaniaceae bacterium]
MIRTVLGDIPGDALGHAQCHEHLFIEKGVSFSVNPALHMDDAKNTNAELLAYKKSGGGAVVDAQPIYCGRMARALADASSRSGVHIVAATGFHKTIFYGPDSPLFWLTERQLADTFVSDVREGMLDVTGRRVLAKAGILKAALDERGWNAVYERLLQALIAAAMETDAPILIHTDPNTDVLGLLRRFMDAGVYADRIIVCHLCRTRYDFAYHKEVLSTGAFLCYDSVNRLKYISHEQMIALILEMLSCGYEDQLLLSLDTTRERLNAYGGYMGLDYILTSFIPMLREHGVLQHAVSAMTVKNAARALSFQ